MIRTTTGWRGLRALTGMALAFALLAACDGISGQSDGASGQTTGPARNSIQSDSDIEAPEEFQLTEAALWDGRPSLGGVWVAHPDVTEPRRVIIRNGSNNTSVVGALFRRERDNPGPRIQASSDAAEALGMLAGAPVELSVTALVRAPEPELDAADNTGSDATGNTEPAAEEISTADQPAAADEVNAAATATGPDPEPRRGFRWPWSRQPASAAAAGATAGATVAATGPDAKEPEASSLDKPYVQAAIFSEEDNADRAASQLRTAGFSPRVREQTGGTRTLWRVLVGPSGTASEQESVLAKLRESGYPDAYAVAN